MHHFIRHANAATWVKRCIITVFPVGLGAGIEVCLDGDTLCCPAASACPRCSSKPALIPPRTCLCSYRVFHQVPEVWHFLFCASSDPPHFPHLTWMTVGREGSGADSMARDDSDVRKRDRLQRLFFPPLQWKELWDVNYFLQIGLPVKFCTTACLHWRQAGISLN